MKAHFVACCRGDAWPLSSRMCQHRTSTTVGGAYGTGNHRSRWRDNCNHPQAKRSAKCFWSADVYGRKVDTGFVKIVYRGRGNDGSALMEQVDVDVECDPGVFTRMPAMAGASSQATVTGNSYPGYGTVNGQGTSQA